MLQKLRRAMIRPERDHIAGTLEVDEAYVGGVEEGKGGGRRRDSSKSIVVAAVAPSTSGSRLSLRRLQLRAASLSPAYARP